MSDTDSFIDEVTEELRRDQLYQKMRRYGWIAILAVLLIVGGAAYSEYRKAQVRAEAEALGDAMLAAMVADDPKARASALAAIDPQNAQAAMVVAFLEASEQAQAGNVDAAVASLDAVSLSSEAPEVYRQIAQFKSLLLQTETLPAGERRTRFEALAQPGYPMRLLAEEQVALIQIEEGDAEAAIAGFQAILSDAEVSPHLQQRALQVIVALGGEPDLDSVPGAAALTGEGN